ncbi:MAG TPA: NUDIX hydrolase [Roseomonas sp.]|jgi:8-oxo-dGTP pyrophosphatase MutT (NUDIX family)
MLTIPQSMPVRPGQQYGALPLRGDGGPARVLLLTSRDTGRWVLPKGWAEERLTGPQLAAKEAFEEGGLLGEVATEAFGSYCYVKRLKQGGSMRCVVDAFVMRVERELDEWPERHQRRRQWFSLRDAAGAVAEPELAALLLKLATLVERPLRQGPASVLSPPECRSNPAMTSITARLVRKAAPHG